MKVRSKQKIVGGPFYVSSGDSITLKYMDENGVEHKVLESIGRSMWLTHTVIFDVEPTDFEGAKDGIGGAFLEMES